MKKMLIKIQIEYFDEGRADVLNAVSVCNEIHSLMGFEKMTFSVGDDTDTEYRYDDMWARALLKGRATPDAYAVNCMVSTDPT